VTSRAYAASRPAELLHQRGVTADRLYAARIRLRGWLAARHSVPVEAAAVVGLYISDHVARGLVGDTAAAVRYSQRLLVRIVAVLYPGVVLLIVVATGNHSSRTPPQVPSSPLSLQRLPFALQSARVHATSEFQLQARARRR
jgi:hypothetical protein